MRNTGKKYTYDFKKMIMEIYNSGKPIQEIFSEYGIASATLYKYLKNPPSNESKKPIIKIDTCSNDVKKDKEVLKLRKEMELIKEENEIFKKDIAMFTKKENQY